MNIFLQLFTGDATLQRRIGRWALQDALTTKEVRIQGHNNEEGRVVEIEVDCEIDFILRWLTNLPKEEDVKIEELVDVTVSGLIDFWKLYEIISQIKRLEFELEGYEAKINAGIKETEFEMKFLVPVSYFMESPAETQTQPIVSVSIEDGQTKNEDSSTENKMLKKLKDIVQQSESESAMIANIISVLKLNSDAAELFRRAYINYKDLDIPNRKQLRAALAPAFEGKRIDYTMRELKKLYAQYHTQGDGDDTNSEESEDQEEESHT